MKQTILYVVLILFGIKIVGFGLVASAYSFSIIPLAFVLVGGGMAAFGAQRLLSKPVSADTPQ